MWAPWHDSWLAIVRNVIVFAVWVCLMAIGVMVTVFLVALTYEFLSHLWGFLKERWFSSPWAIHIWLQNR